MAVEKEGGGGKGRWGKVVTVEKEGGEWWKRKVVSWEIDTE